jgi:uncharacterized protein (TIGR02145 family)
MIEALRFSDSTSVPSLKGKTECTDEICLYTWAAAMDSVNTGCGIDNVCPTRYYQGICPSGWHVPLYVDWEALFNTVKAEDDSVYNLLLNKYDFWGTMPDTNSVTKAPFWLAATANGSKESMKIFCKNYKFHWIYTNDYYRKDFPSAVRCVKD